MIINKDICSRMKPKELKLPYKWQERKVVFSRQECILYVPDYYDHYEEYTFPGWDSPLLFGNMQPVYIEYCSGHGHWIVNKAKANKHINWVAVEKRFDRVQKIYSKRCNENLDNLFIICGEANLISKSYIPNASVEQVFINFPDPWPKKKHTKNRLINDAFLNELTRILKHESTLSIVTDDRPYAEYILEIFDRFKDFKSCYLKPYYVCHCPEYGTSYFQELWNSKEKIIRYFSFYYDKKSSKINSYDLNMI